MRFKKIFGLAAICILMLQVSVYANFKKAAPVTLTNGDGSRIEAFVTGDEYVHVLHDIDEYVLVKNESGFFEYAVIENNKLVPCGKEKGIKYSEIPEEYFLSEKEKIFSAMEENGIVVPGSSASLFSGTDTVMEFKGEGTVIVVPIAFSGGSCDFSGITQSVNDACEYFKEVSYGELNLGFYDVSEDNEVFVSDYAEAYYQPYNDPYGGTNPDGYMNDDERLAREEELVAAAISHYGLTEKRIDAPLDVNGDGENDFLVFVYNIEQETTWNSLLWAHQIEYVNPRHNILGKNVKRWIFVPRSERSETLSHEMYHSIGAEDLYGYSDQRYYLGLWDIMDRGNGTMLGYMKYRYGGWIDEIPEITEPGTYTLNPVHKKTNNCYKIPINDREYYVVEYRDRFSGRVNCLDRTRQWHNEGLIITRVDSAYHGKGNSKMYVPGIEISLVTHPVLGMNSVLGAILPEFSPKSGFDRSLASGGVDDKTVIKNIRENVDGTLSFDLSFDGETTQEYEELDDVIIYPTMLHDSEYNKYFRLTPTRITKDSDGNTVSQDVSDEYDVKYIYITGSETSANSYEYLDYAGPVPLNSNGLLWAYMVDADGKRVGESYCSNIYIYVPGINTAKMINEYDYGAHLYADPEGKKLSYLSFADGDKYTGKIFMDNIVNFTVDGVEYEFLSEDIRGQQLVFAADLVEVSAGDGSEVYMNGMEFDDYIENSKILFDSNNGRNSLFEKAETITAGDKISLSVPEFAGEIRYTLDGTVPTMDSALYEEPIAFSSDAKLKAASFLNGELKDSTTLDVYVQEDYREYSAVELNKIFKNSGSSFAGGEGKYVKICYTKGDGTLILRDSEWYEVAKIVNPLDDGVIYIDAQDEVFVKEASGDIFGVSVVDSSFGVDMSILKDADLGGNVAVHSFDSVGDFEVIISAFDGDRFVGATSEGISLSENDTVYLPFSAISGTTKAFCFEALEKLEPKGLAVSK